MEQKEYLAVLETTQDHITAKFLASSYEEAGSMAVRYLDAINPQFAPHNNSDFCIYSPEDFDPIDEYQLSQFEHKQRRRHIDWFKTVVAKNDKTKEYNIYCKFSSELAVSYMEKSYPETFLREEKGKRLYNITNLLNKDKIKIYEDIEESNANQFIVTTLDY